MLFFFFFFNEDLRTATGAGISITHNKNKPGYKVDVLNVVSFTLWHRSIYITNTGKDILLKKKKKKKNQDR